MDFEKIVTNADIYRGPAQGHSGGEHGDNWNDAVEKINKNFEKVKGMLEGTGADPIAVYDQIKEIVAIETTDLRTRIEAMEAFFAPQGSAHAPEGDGLENVERPDGYVAPPKHETTS